jgi:hypothetical protein
VDRRSFLRRLLGGILGVGVGIVGTRVQLGKLPSGDYGLLVTGPGGTVIIDGTSLMFKVSASGSTSLAFPGVGGSSVTTVSLPGLGTVSTVPACLMSLAPDTTSVTEGRFTGTHFKVQLASGHISYNAFATISLSADPGIPEVKLITQSPLDNPGFTAALKFYVLAEAGI